MKKDQKYFFKRCRLCGRCYDGAIDIFSPKEKNLQELIHQCLNIKVREDDALPKKLCQFCYKKLILWEKFKNSCDCVQVKLIADSLPKKIELTKTEKNGRSSDSPEDNHGLIKNSSRENLPRRRSKCKKEDGIYDSHDRSASNAIQQCDESTTVVPDEKVKLDFKINCNSVDGCRSKHRGQHIQNIFPIQNVWPYVSSYESNIKDSKTKVLEITDQEIKDINDTISMNLNSEYKLKRATTAEVNNNDNNYYTASGPEENRNNILARKLRKIQHKELKLKNKKKKPLKEYCCQVCKEVFHSQRKMRSHLKSHSNEAPEHKSPKLDFQCPHCPQKLTTAFNLHQHLDTHSETCNYCCHICGKLFKTNSSLLNHLRVHICDEMKASGRDSTILANGHSVKLYQCQVCDRKFRQSGHLAKHLKIHAGIRHFTCGECGMSFTEKYQLRRHVGGVHEKAKRYTCDACGKQFLHTHNYKNHILQHEGIASVSCDVCGKAFVTSHAMNRHRRLHTGEKPFVCDICGKAFRDCSNRKRHRDKHIKEAEKALAANKPSEEESVCPLNIIDTAQGLSRKLEVIKAEIVESENDHRSEGSETVDFNDKINNEEEGNAKKIYMNLKTYFESHDVVSLKDDDEDGDNIGSPLDIIPLNGNHVNLSEEIHATGKFDETSNPGPLFGGLFGEELDLNPESLLLIGDERINNSLLEEAENDGESIKEELVWVPSSNNIQSDVALSSIHSGDIALNGIQDEDISLSGIQGDVGLNTIQTGDMTGILEVGMELCSEFDVNSAMDLDSGKDELPGDFPSISEIKAEEESDKSLDNVLCLQVCILV